MKENMQFYDACCRLREAAPHAWNDFTNALRFLTASKAADLVKAPAETIFMVQGQARGYNELLQMMLNAPSVIEKARADASRSS